MEQSLRPEVINSKIIKCGSKTYFFDVKKSKSGNNYLTISETWKKTNGEVVRNRLMIFPDHLEEFSKTLIESGQYLK